MTKILIIGASGFIGGCLAKAFMTGRHQVRCLVRNPSKVLELGNAGAEIVKGDMLDRLSLEKALKGVQAVYITIHTLSSQAANADQGFMEIEMNGVKNIVEACRTNDVRRVIYVTSTGVSADAESVWLRERWKIEEFLLTSGLNASVLHPGMIVGAGGRGFGMMVSRAKKSLSVNLFGGGRSKMSSIAIDDLVYYLLGILEDPRSYGKRFEVGCNDMLTNNQMTDIVAEVLGHSHPIKVDAPQILLLALAPLIERAAKMPKGSIKGVLGGSQPDMNVDLMPIRSFLPREPLLFREAVRLALTEIKMKESHSCP